MQILLMLNPTLSFIMIKSFPLKSLSLSHINYDHHPPLSKLMTLNDYTLSLYSLSLNLSLD